jgi:preprotein translocase subunit YajC
MTGFSGYDFFRIQLGSETAGMNFFISDAMAADPVGGSDALTSFLPLIVIFVIFYFLLIRPQSKKAKEQKQMIGALAKGDEIVTNGGVLGKITKVGDSFLTLEVADGVQLNIQRHAVATLMPKGTIKEL